MNEINHFIDDLCQWIEWNSKNMKIYGYSRYTHYYPQDLNDFFFFEKTKTFSQFTLHDYIYNKNIWKENKIPFEIVKEKMSLQNIFVIEIHDEKKCILFISHQF